MNVGLKRILNEKELEQIKELYLSAFPANERREFSELVCLLSENECFIYRISIEKTIFAGFCICWNFNDFAFIEHFAIIIEKRSQGIGEKTLTLLKTELQKTIILETEPPVDELTTRRVRFYQRNGFRLLHRYYIQPSYGNNKPEVELKLMFSGEEPDLFQVDNMIGIVKYKVYNSK